MKIIEIQSNLPRHHTIGAGGAKGATHGEIVLKPGRNDINTEDWDKVKGLPVMRHYITKGEIEEKDKIDTAGITDLKPGEAIRKVKDTLDVETLRKWAEGETRVAVTGAITEQITRVESQRKTDEKK